MSQTGELGWTGRVDILFASVDTEPATFSSMLRSMTGGMLRLAIRANISNTDVGSTYDIPESADRVEKDPQAVEFHEDVVCAYIKPRVLSKKVSGKLKLSYLEVRSYVNRAIKQLYKTTANGVGTRSIAAESGDVDAEADPGSFAAFNSAVSPEGPSSQLPVLFKAAQATTEQIELLIAVEIDGFSFADLAEMHRLPVGTLKSRYYRFILRLKQTAEEIHMEI